MLGVLKIIFRRDGVAAQGLGAGEFKIKDAGLAALAIGGMVSWAYVWYRPGGRLSLEELAREMSSLIMSLAGATRGD